MLGAYKCIDCADCSIAFQRMLTRSAASRASDSFAESFHLQPHAEYLRNTADGSFVETTSGPAARELKRRYDQQTGLSEDMRSPYVVTAIINQHGKQVYRVGCVISICSHRFQSVAT